MIIKTKKYSLPKSKYIKTVFKALIHKKWWHALIPLIFMVFFFYIKWKKSAIGCIVLSGGYILFRYIQVYALTLVEGNKMLFQPFNYQISSKYILMQINPKQGMNITWEKVRKAEQGEDFFTLYMSSFHFIHLPKKIFKSPQDILFFTMLLKRKKLIP